jgi:class 3 adenylate cyclase/tetratricopeptide (TPR) repeat protein
MSVCRACGAESPEGARFCGSCGERLPAPTVESPARKAVTILFADVSGFTTLSERVDPELMSGLMSLYFGEMRTILDRHGGTVEKFIGDAVMAVFGIPTLHEDDAIRAVRAAVEMRDRLAGLNDELEADWGERLKLHVGINTGVVATGTNTLVVGDAVNVAARLQQRAAPDEIVLGEETYQLVRGVVEVDPLEHLELKGKAAPVAAYRLIGVARDAFQRRSRFHVPLVGRQAEYEALMARYDDVVATRTCQLMAVMAPAGVGKSRLIEEFTGSVGERAAILRGFCDPYGDGITFLPLAEVLRQAAAIDDGDPPDAMRAKLAATVGPDESPAVVEHLGHVLGLAADTHTTDELFWAARKLFESLARRRPLVLVFEDVHWAEPTFLDLLEHLRAWSRDAPVLVLCSTRPDILERYPAWAGDAPNLFRLDLAPLSEDESHHLVDTILGAPVAGGRLPAQVVATADGNPLYLVEILGMLIDKGLLVEHEGTWVLPGGGQQLDIPPSIQAIVGSRLERLAGEARHVIEAGSVMGTTFRRPPLGHLLTTLEDERLDRALQAVVHEQLLVPAAGTDDDLRFYHVVARDVAYAGASKETRWGLHHRFAEWLETSLGDRAADQDDVIGYHLEQASSYLHELHPGDERAAELGRRAGRRLAAAGRTALDRGDLVAGANLLSRARALLPEGDPLRLSVLPALSDALLLTGQLEQAMEILEEGLGRADEAGDPRVRAHLALVGAMIRLFTEPQGGAEAARLEVEAAMPVFEEAGDELGLARSWRLLSLVYLVWARFGMAERAMANAHDHARRAGDRREALEALSWLPLLVWAGPTPPAEGRQRCREIEAQAGGDQRVQASALLIRGAFEVMEGSFDEARSHADQARSLLEDLGLTAWIAGPGAQVRGWIELLAGDPVAAERELREGYRTLTEMHDAGWISTVAGLLGRALCAQGRYEEAEEHARLCQEAASSDDVYSQVLGMMVRAQCGAARPETGLPETGLPETGLPETGLPETGLPETGLPETGLGDSAEAVELARAAVGLCQDTDFLLLHGDALVVAADVLAAAGRMNDADEALDQARRLYHQKGCVAREERVGTDGSRPDGPGRETPERT